MTGVKLKRKTENRKKDITDVDAIGEKDNIVLILECKSVLNTNDNITGEHSFARNRAEKLETYVQDAKRKEKELNDNLVGSNYNMEGYKVVIVVCTPNPVYTELDLVRNCHRMRHIDELGSIKEVAPELSAAVSFIELERWLHKSPV